MKENGSPLTPGFVLAMVGGLVGTALFALGALIALGMLAAPVEALASTAVQIVVIALGLLLMAIEVKALLTFLRARGPKPPADGS